MKKQTWYKMTGEREIKLSFPPGFCLWVKDKRTEDKRRVLQLLLRPFLASPWYPLSWSTAGQPAEQATSVASIGSEESVFC